MRPALLDTSGVIAAASSTLDLTDAEGFGPLLLSSLTYAELRAGIVAARDVGEALRRQAVLERVAALFGPGLPFDDAAAARYAEIVRLSVARGASFRTNQVDRMIAAVAAAEELPVLTMNGSDLRGLASVVEVVEVRAT